MLVLFLANSLTAASRPTSLQCVVPENIHVYNVFPPPLWNSILGSYTLSKLLALKIPLPLGLSNNPLWWGMHIFWNHTIYSFSIYPHQLLPTNARVPSQTLFYPPPSPTTLYKTQVLN